MSAQPKTLLEKTAQYQNDSFNVWLQKTNVVAQEEGDLNNLDTNILETFNTQISGTASVVSKDTTTVTGTGTYFRDQLVVGNMIKLSSGSDSWERIVLEIKSNTELSVDAPFNKVISGSVIHNISAINLVSAINRTYQFVVEQARNILIKAIAMS